MEKLAILGGPAVRTTAWPDWPECDERESRALQRVLESRSWGGFPSPNREARAFSEAFAGYVGTRFAVPCANGTFSLTLALQAAGLSPGAEVITTAYTFVGTAGGIVAAGGVPVFVDILADSYCLDPDAVEAAISERTEAVIPVHLASAMADMDRLAALCSARGLILIEDCAHAHGMRWRGRCAGSIGDLGSFSMQSSKLLTAGEGGAITTDSPELEARLQTLVNCGRRDAARCKEVEPMLGHNLRMTEWQAAVLSAQLERLDEQHARRATGVARLREGLASVPGVSLPLPDPRLSPTHYQVILRYQAEEFGGIPRDAVVLALEAEGIPCSGRFYVPLNEDPLFPLDPRTNPAARARDYARETFPIARRAAYEESLWLPHQIFLGGAQEVDDVVAALRKIQEQAESLRT